MSEKASRLFYFQYFLPFFFLQRVRAFIVCVCMWGFINAESRGNESGPRWDLRLCYRYVMGARLGV
jgi:hypothetical protein